MVTLTRNKAKAVQVEHELSTGLNMRVPNPYAALQNRVVTSSRQK